MSANQGKTDFGDLGPVLVFRVAGLLVVLFLFAAFLFETT